MQGCLGIESLRPKVHKVFLWNAWLIVKILFHQILFHEFQKIEICTKRDSEGLENWRRFYTEYLAPLDVEAQQLIQTKYMLVDDDHYTGQLKIIILVKAPIFLYFRYFQKIFINLGRPSVLHWGMVGRKRTS